MSFYKRITQSFKWGYPLNGGPFSKWRVPFARVLYKKRLVAGPEPIRHRSVWPNWNYDSEIYAFGQRLGENFNQNLLRTALIDSSFVKIEKEKLKEIQIESNQLMELEDNSKLHDLGRNLTINYIKAVLQFWYPRFPQEGINSIVEYLLSTDKLSHIAQNIALTELIKTEEFPLKNETKAKSLLAVIGALSESSGVIQAHLFVNDFILTKLIGKNLNELWNVVNPMGLLVKELEADKIDKNAIKTRLLWATGSASPTAAFIVGLYINEKLIAKGGGETVDIAEEMATRQALAHIYGTTEDAAPLPFGDKARKYSEIIKSLYDTIQKNK